MNARATILDDLERLKASLTRIDEDETASLHLALASCVKALRFAKDADGLSPSRRQAARSAYRLGAAALGIEAE